MTPKKRLFKLKKELRRVQNKWHKYIKKEQRHYKLMSSLNFFRGRLIADDHSTVSSAALLIGTRRSFVRYSLSITA